MGTFIENNPTIVFLALSAIVGIAYWAGSIHARVGTFGRFMQEVRDDIKEIRKDIRELFKWIPSAAVDKSSPLQLTELGKTISAELKASDWVKQTVPALLVRVEGKDPYEIQEFCLEYVTEEFIPSEDMDREVRTCAYENGLTKRQVLEVLAVELRDELLKSVSSMGRD